MRLERQDLGAATLITVPADRIDSAVAVQFKDALRECAEGGPPRVILDLRNVGFLDSSGLGAVVAAMKHLAPEQQLELAGLTPAVAGVFKLTRMDSVFTIHSSAAVAADGLAPAS